MISDIKTQLIVYISHSITLDIRGLTISLEGTTERDFLNRKYKLNILNIEHLITNKYNKEKLDESFAIMIFGKLKVFSFLKA